MALLGGAIVGLPAAAVLVVNNTRDLENDREAGRRTFPVLFGVSASRVQYALLLLAVFPLAIWLGGSNFWGLLPLLALPMAGQLIRHFGEAGDGLSFNQLLAATARFQVFFGLLLCGGLLAGAIARSA